MKTTFNDIDEDFCDYCRTASDKQLEAILAKEFDARRDYNSARLVAAERGWTVTNGKRIN